MLPVLFACVIFSYIIGLCAAGAYEDAPIHLRVTLVSLSPVVLPIALAWLMAIGVLYVARSWLQTARWLRRKWRLRQRAESATAPREGVYR